MYISLFFGFLHKFVSIWRWQCNSNEERMVSFLNKKWRSQHLVKLRVVKHFFRAREKSSLSAMISSVFNLPIFFHRCVLRCRWLVCELRKGDLSSASPESRLWIYSTVRRQAWQCAEICWQLRFTTSGHFRFGNSIVAKQFDLWLVGWRLSNMQVYVAGSVWRFYFATTLR